MVKSEEKTETETIKPKFKLAIDLDALVTQTRALYDKKEAGIAKQISTGNSITKSTNESDYILPLNKEYFNELVGIPGLKLGSFTQLSGAPDSGKSTQAACFMVAAQQQGVLVILWDSEGKFQRRRYDEKMGGDSSSLIVTSARDIEDGAVAVANIVNAAKAQNPKIKILVVWDSVGASMNSKENLEDGGENFSNQPGVDAREISKAMKKFNKLIFKYQDRETGENSIAFLIVNQIYAQIGFSTGGSVERGGTQLQYLCSVIIQMRRKKDLNRIVKGVSYKYGIVTRAKVRKNHLFDGDQCVAEMDLEVSAAGVRAYTKGKSTNDGDIVEDDEE